MCCAGGGMCRGGPDYLLLTIVAAAHIASRHLAHSAPPDASSKLGEPEIDYSMPVRVVAQLGQTSRLNCRVYRLNNYKVVWLKKSEAPGSENSGVLAAGSKVFVKDDRLQIIHRKGSPNWTLQIKLTRLADQGAYECQVTTKPKMAYIVHLYVKEAFAVIHGPESAQSGDTVTLRCEIKSVVPPAYVDWRMNGTLLAAGPGSRSASGPGSVGVTTSALTMRRVEPGQAGGYTCGAPGVHTAHHTLAVLYRGSQTNKFRSSDDPTSASELTRVTARMGSLFVLPISIVGAYYACFSSVVFY